MRKLWVFALSALGCAGAPVGQQSAGIYGAVTYSPACSYLAQANLNEAMFFGRTVTSTYSFQQCVESAFTEGIPVPSFLALSRQVPRVGPYQGCTSPPDPAASSTLAYADEAVSFARSSNPLYIDCAASADGHGSRTSTGTESIAIANAEGTDAQSLAGRIWLQQLQLHGFTFGDASNADCGNQYSIIGYSGQVSSGPGIVADCIEYVLQNSAYVCNGGSTQVGTCSPTQLHLVQDYNEPDYCECDYDPDNTPAPTYGGGGAGPSGPYRKNPPLQM